MLQGICPVKFNKGETYSYKIEFDSVSAEYITAVYISCSQLNFSHPLIQNQTNTKLWEYLFTDDETDAFQAVNTFYTLTVESSIPEIEVSTLINQKFIVQNDENPKE